MPTCIKVTHRSDLNPYKRPSLSESVTCAKKNHTHTCSAGEVNCASWLLLRESGAAGSHAVDSVVIHELFEVLEVVPPFEEESVCDEAEPGRDQHLIPLGLLQQLLQLLFGDVAVALHLVGVWLQLHVLLQEQDVVDLMLPPHPVRLGLVVDAGQVGHLLWRHLVHGNAELSL